MMATSEQAASPSPPSPASGEGGASVAHVPNPNAPPPLPAQAAAKRPLRHRQPAARRAPFLPADHLHAKRQLHGKS